MPVRFIASPTNPHQPANAAELRVLFGVPSHRWPDWGCPARCIQDIWVHVLPVYHVSLRPLRPGKTRRTQHRCIATCPECGASVSAGRLALHQCDARVNKTERLRRHQFQKTLAETRARAEETQRRLEANEATHRAHEAHWDREFPEGQIDGQPLSQLGDQE